MAHQHTAELQERERRAWRCYAGRVRGLEGEHYDTVERDAWAELRAELREIERAAARAPEVLSEAA
jgi:hypothetical protein